MQIEKYNVFTGTDNVIELTLTEDGIALGDHTAITRMLLEIGVSDTLLSAAPHTILDSDVSSALFDFTNLTYVGLVLGEAGLAVGRHIARMKIFTVAYPNGAAWKPLLELHVA